MGHVLDEKIKKVRVPRQKRSIETRERILDSAMRLFSAKGYHGTNSKEIAAEAGVAIGSFYSYFEDKKVLFIEALDCSFRYGLEQFLGEFVDRDGSFEVESAKESLGRYVKQLLSVHDFSTEFHREAAAMIFSDSSIRKVHDEQEAYVLHHIASYLRSLGDKVRVTDVEAAAVVVYRSIESIVHAIKISGRCAYEDRVVDELTDMLVRYIFDTDKNQL